MPGKSGCPVCFGDGGWEDPIAEQSVLCPLCFPVEYNRAAHTDVDVDWLPGYPRMPCKYHGPKFPVTPWLFVLHCGATSGSVAEFMMNSGFWIKKSTGKKIYVSAHFNWSNAVGNITQGVPLDTVAWHVGGSNIEYERLKKIWPEAPAARLRKLNFCSYGMELTGPAGRRFNVGEHNRVKDLIIALRKRNPQLRVATKHQHICPSKRDTGKGFDLSVLEEAGMVIYE